MTAGGERATVSGHLVGHLVGHYSRCSVKVILDGISIKSEDVEKSRLPCVMGMGLIHSVEGLEKKTEMP